MNSNTDFSNKHHKKEECESIPYLDLSANMDDQNDKIE